jgi:hypothetical protein
MAMVDKRHAFVRSFKINSLDELLRTFVPASIGEIKNIPLTRSRAFQETYRPVTAHWNQLRFQNFHIRLYTTCAE